LSKHALPDAGADLFSRLRELCDETLDPLDLTKKALAQTFGLKLEIADLFE
jgi:hypothetical protein